MTWAYIDTLLVLCWCYKIVLTRYSPLGVHICTGIPGAVVDTVPNGREVWYHRDDTRDYTQRGLHVQRIHTDDRGQ